MRQERWVFGITYAFFSFIWFYLVIHYFEILSIYAANAFHVNHTALYIAVESWWLLSLVVFTLLVVKMVGEMCRGDTDGR